MRTPRAASSRRWPARARRALAADHSSRRLEQSLAAAAELVAGTASVRLALQSLVERVDLEADGEFAEQLFVHGLGVQTAEGLAEWLHARVRSDLGIERTRGRRYSWGYPAVPDQSEHDKVDALLDLSRIGMTLTDGHAPEPEQSTLAIVAHHPQAVYFGMKSGFLPKSDRQARDELVAGTDKDPTRLGTLPDADPEGGEQPAMAGQGS